MIQVLVTGANGQLGRSIQEIAPEYANIAFVFKNSTELDITDPQKIASHFEGAKYDYCINCAAYTNVEEAEKEQEQAFLVNAESVRNVSLACSKNEVVFIHISTDYVFDGENTVPYKTSDKPNPINVYGASKLRGEAYVQDQLTDYFIIRTSWLYSEFGKNFYKTILRKASTEKVLRITDEQIGCPTHARNLATYILDLIANESKDYGIHHYTDGEAMSWYGFAKRILRDNGLGQKGLLEKAKNYRTFAARPKYSVLEVS